MHKSFSHTPCHCMNMQSSSCHTVFVKYSILVFWFQKKIRNSYIELLKSSGLLSTDKFLKNKVNPENKLFLCSDGKAEEAAGIFIPPLCKMLLRKNNKTLLT